MFHEIIGRSDSEVYGTAVVGIMTEDAQWNDDICVAGTEKKNKDI